MMRKPRPHPALSALGLFFLPAAVGLAAQPDRPPARPGAEIVVDAKARTVTLPATVAKQGTHDVLKGAIEYVLVAKGGKDYETVFVTPFTAEAIHAALAKIGLTPGRPASHVRLPRGRAVEIVAVYEKDGRTHRRPVDELVAYIKTGKPLKPQPWIYTGSATTADPKTGKTVLKAAITGSLVGLHYTDPTPLVQNPRPEGKQENLYKANLKLLPPAGTPVRLVVRWALPAAPKGTRRVHVFLTGRVQGVGFRAFTQRNARALRLAGFVRNLRDGRVEAVIEGPAKAVDALLAKLRRGPRAARVKELDVKDEPPDASFKGFVIER